MTNDIRVNLMTNALAESLKSYELAMLRAIRSLQRVERLVIERRRYRAFRPRALLLTLAVAAVAVCGG